MAPFLLIRKGLLIGTGESQRELVIQRGDDSTSVEQSSNNSIKTSTPSRYYPTHSLPLSQLTLISLIFSSIISFFLIISVFSSIIIENFEHFALWIFIPKWYTTHTVLPLTFFLPSNFKKYFLMLTEGFVHSKYCIALYELNIS